MEDFFSGQRILKGILFFNKYLLHNVYYTNINIICDKYILYNYTYNIYNKHKYYIKYS
jgi:hypothetical protein